MFCACAAAALYRLDAVRSVGGFDSDLFCYMEDVDLGFRLRLMGYSCRLVIRAKVEHVGSGLVRISVGDRDLLRPAQSRLGVREEHACELIWVLLPLHLVLNAMMIVVCALRGQLAVVVQAKFDALKGLKGLPAKRRAVQAHATAPTGAIWRALSKSLVPGN